MKKLLIVEQTLLVNTFEYVQRTVWRICIVMLEQKGSRTPLSNLILPWTTLSVIASLFVLSIPYRK